MAKWDQAMVPVLVTAQESEVAVKAA